MENTKNITPQEKVAAAKERVKMAQKRLEQEFAAIKIAPNTDSHKLSPYERLTKLAAARDETPQQTKPAPYKEMSLADLAQHNIDLQEKAVKAGISIAAMSKATDDNTKGKNKPEQVNAKKHSQEAERTQKPERGAGVPDKKGNEADENNNDKDKKGKEEQTPEKQEQKMREMFSKVNLPSGMEIHQEGPSWVLVSKDGRQRTDVTDVMNSIDKFNREVDAKNDENRMFNEAQSSADKAVDKGKAEDLDKSGTTISYDEKTASVSEALPMVKDVDGNQVFKDEDIQKIAETGISFSDELTKLEQLKDPKALEEMQKRNKRNEEKADKKAENKVIQQMMQQKNLDHQLENR